MSLETHKRAKGIIDQGRIRAIVLNPSAHIFIFQIREPNDDVTTVSLNHKGWMCDYLESNESYSKRVYWAKKHNLKKVEKFSHSMMYGKIECSHILACKLYLERAEISTGKPPVVNNSNTSCPENTETLGETLKGGAPNLPFITLEVQDVQN